MKKVLMLFVAMAAMLPASMSAYDFKEGGLYYNVNGNEAAVTFEVENVGSYSGDVVIPETVVHNGVEYPVTAIGYKAFCFCYNLTSIEIPNSIDSISSHAFKGCERLPLCHLYAVEGSLPAWHFMRKTTHENGCQK